MSHRHVKSGIVLSWFLIWMVVETEGDNEKKYWNYYITEATDQADCEVKLAKVKESLQGKNYIARCEQR